MSKYLFIRTFPSFEVLLLVAELNTTLAFLPGKENGNEIQTTNPCVHGQTQQLWVTTAFVLTHLIKNVSQINKTNEVNIPVKYPIVPLNNILNHV